MRIVLKEEIVDSSLGICYPAGTWLDAKSKKNRKTLQNENFAK